MRKLLLPLFILILLSACKGTEQKAPDFEAKRDSMLRKSRNPRIERMKDYHYTTNIDCTWADAYAISRGASDSLGMVTDDEGTRYVNNQVQLALTSGGTTVFRHVFTKADFASMGEPAFFRRAVLQGMAFDVVRDGEVRFVASVGMPDSDEYVQFAITIPRDGNYIIEPTEVIDESLVEN